MSKDFQKMNTEDLHKAITEKRAKLLDIRFSFAGSRTKKTKDVRTLKREIAQILTVLKTTK
ncbi:MAG: Ribosomal protein [Candidatus Parcubacteria bacterium]|jgi:ribosomal protein L29